MEAVFRSATEEPHWAMSHTIDFIGQYYMKLQMLDSMVNLYENGARDEDFILASNSIDVYSSLPEKRSLERYIETDFGTYIVLERKSHNARLFWNKFHNLKRPIIMLRRNGEYEYTYSEEEAIRFYRIETNSPQRYFTIGKDTLKFVASAVIGHFIGVGIDELIGNNNNQLIYEIQRNRDEIQDLRYSHERLLEMLEMLEMERHQRRFERYDFIDEERRSLENKFRNGLNKRPLIVEDIRI